MKVFERKRGKKRKKEKGEKGKGKREKGKGKAPAGLEPATSRLEVWHAIQLRHGGNLPEGDRTLDHQIKIWRSTD